MASNTKNNKRILAAAWRDTPARAWPLLAVGVAAVALSYLCQYVWFPAKDASVAARAAAPASLRVNEVMTSNRSAAPDDTGAYPDWIELVNETDAPLNVTGWTVSDGEDRLVPFTFPAQALAPGETVLIYASGNLKNVAGYAYHAPYRLSAQGETILVRDQKGRSVDRVEVPSLEPNQVYARDPGSDNWAVGARYTPGLPNTAQNYQNYTAQSGSVAGALAISEVMPDNVSYARCADGNCYDYIELHNAGTQAVNLSGMSLSDDENRPAKWFFPDGATVAPGAYLLVYASGLAQEQGSEIHTSFRLKSAGETVVFSDASGRLIDRLKYAEAEPDRSFSRADAELTADLPPTPGYANDESGVSAVERALASANPVKVYLNEAMASGRKPNSTKSVTDWLELYNASSSAVDLSGYGLSDEASSPRKWQFPSGARIGAGDYLVVALSGADKADVSKGAYAANFRLSFARGETLTLSTPQGQIIDRLPAFNQMAAISYGRMPGMNGYYYMDTPTKGAANSGNAYAGRVSDVSFSAEGGWYDQTVQVSLSANRGATIRYTLDASEPTGESPVYEAPLSISQNTVVRARAYQPGKLASLTATRTYLFGERHALPVVSLVTDPSYLYDEKIGLYTIGANKKLKYPYKGANFWKDWERAANLEYFSTDGKTVLSQGAAMQLQGQYSRMEDQKAFKLTARNAYGPNRFNAALFPNRDYGAYRSVLLRASGQDYNKTRMRDSILTSLADQTPVMYQDNVPVVVYLNGEYWGHYNLRERIHKYSIAQWENWTDPDKIDIVKANDTVLQGSNDDYADFLKWLKKNGCKTAENLKRVEQTVDVDNYLDYVAIEMYIGNTDLLNVKRYRSDEGDGKWRWVLYDTDWAFYTDTDSYRRWLDKGGAGSGKKTDNTLFVQLMKNTEVKKKFLKRFGELMHLSWRSDLVLGRIDERYALLEPEMARHFKKWGGSVSGWKTKVKAFRSYASSRPKKMLTYIKKELGWNNEQMRAYFGDIMNDIGM